MGKLFTLVIVVALGHWAVDLLEDPNSELHGQATEFWNELTQETGGWNSRTFASDGGPTMVAKGRPNLIDYAAKGGARTGDYQRPPSGWIKSWNLSEAYGQYRDAYRRYKGLATSAGAGAPQTLAAHQDCLEAKAWYDALNVRSGR